MRPKRGDVIERPHPWTLIAANSGAVKGWEELKRQSRSNLDRAYMAITGDPRRTDARQHRLKGALGTVKHREGSLDQWQYEVTGGGRVWYLVDDEKRTLWLTWAGTGHPKRTE
ncbi:hypothetical protein [Actinomadura litoris]|uniref:hypothetical protein n=1 Tax=Actinomadura litoris TaxID=2678616 RepID=UPI001FA6DD47|nr:hypothetical protein [Actinomadura litoris]